MLPLFSREQVTSWAKSFLQDLRRLKSASILLRGCRSHSRSCWNWHPYSVHSGLSEELDDSELDMQQEVHTVFDLVLDDYRVLVVIENEINYSRD